MITVFTPVYNRAHTMGRLYQSLLDQECSNFEWLIVDDGSEDHIDQLVSQWMEESRDFEIRFYRQENGGKHRAINRGVQLAKGDAFFIVDSDDYLTNDAIEVINNWWKDISDNDDFAGVSGLRARENGEVILEPPTFDEYIDVTNLQRNQYKLDGDKAEVYKTELLRKYPFPEFENENFLTEGVIWDKIAYEGYKIRWYNRVTYICEYREDGLTHKGEKKFYDNPKGWALNICQSRIFGQNDALNDFAHKLHYYGQLRNQYKEEDFIRNLCLEKDELDHIKKYVENTVERIGKKIAIYGLGTRGQWILKLYEGTSIEIEYVLDQSKKDEQHVQLELDDEWGKVDAIIVTPKIQQDEIVEWLRKKTTNRILKYTEWINILIK